MEPNFKVKDLYQKSQPVAITDEAYTISTFLQKNSYNVTSAEARVIVLPNIVEADGCEFIFVPGTCTGNVKVDDDAGNTIITLLTNAAPTKLESAGGEWCQFDLDTDTHA